MGINPSSGGAQGKSCSPARGTAPLARVARVAGSRVGHTQPRFLRATLPFI